MNTWISLSTGDAAWTLLAAGIVLVLPGAAWLAWLPVKHTDWLEWLADAVGLSVSLTALAGLAAFLLDFHFSAAAVLILYGLCLLTLAVGWILRPSRQDRSPGGWRWRLWLAGLAGFAGLAGMVAWRFYQARSLVLPAWVDSLHHTLIVSKILENGGIPASLAPQVLADLSYHYGFHLITAVFTALSGLEPASSVLWFGQLLNAVIALAVYRLVKTLWGDWRRAGLAALLVAFAFHMPAYYVTWGRYTLSAGLVLLPLAMAAVLRTSCPPVRAADGLALAVLAAGTALTHLTALLLLGFFVAFVLAGGLIQRLSRRRTAEPPNEGQPHFLDGLWQPAAAALSGLLLALPWLARIWLRHSTSAGMRVVSPLDSGQADYFNYILYLLSPQHNLVLLGLAAAGLLWSLFQRGSRQAAGWALWITLLTLPWGLRLPPFRPDHMAIVLFLPASLMAANGLVSVLDGLGRVRITIARRALQGILTVAILGLVGWGMLRTQDVINPATVFVSQADLEAVEWVKTHTPGEARFLINTTTWMTGSYRGVDGGYWLAVLTGRTVLLPPALYTLGEAVTVRQINDWAQRASRLKACDAEFWELVEESGATHIYLREGQGSLQPSALTICSELALIYRRDGVFIYQIGR